MSTVNDIVPHGATYYNIHRLQNTDILRTYNC